MDQNPIRENAVTYLQITSVDQRIQTTYKPKVTTELSLPSENATGLSFLLQKLDHIGIRSDEGYCSKCQHSNLFTVAKLPCKTKHLFPLLYLLQWSRLLVYLSAQHLVTVFSFLEFISLIPKKFILVK